MQILFGIFILVLHYDCILSTSHEKKLWNELFTDYDKLELPIERKDKNVSVEMKFTLNKILDVNEGDRYMTTIMWLSMTWYAYNLKWDPARYGSISKLNVPYEKLWVPDIVLYNSIEEPSTTIAQTKAILYYNGKVLWVPPAIFKSECVFDMTKFPFDNPTCNMKLGSWTYSSNLVDMVCSGGVCDGVDLSSYTENNEFIIKGTQVARKIKTYTCCAEKYVSIDVTLFLSRRASYYYSVCILPIIFISILTILQYLIPTSSNTKLMGGCFITLFGMILLIHMNNMIPKDSIEIPNIIKYLCLITVLNLISLIFAIFSTKFVHGYLHRSSLPWIVGTLINKYMAKVVCLASNKSETDDEDASLKMAENKESETDNKTDSSSDLSVVVGQLKQINNKLKAEKEVSEMAEQWLLASRVIDRFLFIIFLVITLILVLTMFL